MSSYFAKLKEDLAAKQHELQEEQAAVESIEKLTRELEAQKKALMEKLTALDDRREEVRTMQKRLDALAAVEPAMTAAMHTKPTTEDVLKHTVENAIRSDHMTGSEIMHMTLNTVMDVNGLTRYANVEDFLVDLIDEIESLDAPIGLAMNIWGSRDVVEHTVKLALSRDVSIEDIEDLKESMDALLGP